MDKMFEGRKFRWFLVVILVIVIAFSPVLVFRSVAAQSPTITLEEIQKVVEDLLNPLVQKVNSLVDEFNSIKEDVEFVKEFRASQDVTLEQPQQEQVVQAEQPDPVVSSRSVEVVKTIRQVGGSEIIKDWNNENSDKVSIPIIKDLGWENIHKQDGKPLYLIALSSDMGEISFQGDTYEFDKGVVGVFMTTEPESIVVYTEFNAAAEDPIDRHFNVWSEAFVVSLDLDIEETAERTLAEWLVVHGKDLGFYLKLDGTFSKMKFEDAEKYRETHDPLFPNDFPELPDGQKHVVLTVSQVGSGSEIIDGWKTKEFVTIPKPDTREWEGIVKEDDKPVYLVLISSDAGTLKFNNIEKVFKTGFVAAIVTNTPGSITVSTGWNEQSGHQNIWSEKFIVPEDENIDEILKEKLLAWKKTQAKSIAFAILSDGAEFVK